MPTHFICETCDFKCCKKSNYVKHCATRKHTVSVNGYKNDMKKEQKMPQKCECGKEYNYHSGLWRHKKKCNYIEFIGNEEEKIINKPTSNIDDTSTIDLLIKENIDFKNIILELVKNNSDFQKQTFDMQKQNQDLQKQMLDVCKTSGVNNSYNNNKTFNMQVFLNEKCKDAMNLTDFVNSMTLDFSDLEELGELGYVEGISRQMIRKLSEMDVYKRPIHCSDLKRETMYVRDNDVWEKETELYANLRKAIKYITKKNGDLMIPWRNAHPQCMNLQHPLNDKYLGIMNQAMGGKGEFAESESKIIKKISKSVKIDKSDFK